MNKETKEPVHIFSSWCKKCGICTEICSRKVLEKGPDGYPYAARPEECILCGLCDIHCPDYAITLNRRDREKKLMETDHEETR